MYSTRFCEKNGLEMGLTFQYCDIAFDFLCIFIFLTVTLHHDIRFKILNRSKMNKQIIIIVSFQRKLSSMRNFGAFIQHHFTWFQINHFFLSLVIDQCQRPFFVNFLVNLKQMKQILLSLNKDQCSKYRVFTVQDQNLPNRKAIQ